MEIKGYFFLILLSFFLYSCNTHVQKHRVLKIDNNESNYLCLEDKEIYIFSLDSNVINLSCCPKCVLRYQTNNSSKLLDSLFYTLDKKDIVKKREIIRCNKLDTSYKYKYFPKSVDYFSTNQDLLFNIPTNNINNVKTIELNKVPINNSIELFGHFPIGLEHLILDNCSIKNIPDNISRLKKIKFI